MKKAVKWTVAVLAALAALILLIATTALNPMARIAVIKFGHRLTRTEVTVANVRISIFSGRVRVEGLNIGNPKGFESPSAIQIGDLQIVLKPASLFSKVIVVDSIVIDSPEITCEMGPGENNLGRLRKDIEGDAPAGKPHQKSASAPAAESRKARVNDLLIRNGRIKLTAKGMGGAGGSVALPTIHLTDIGKDAGVSVAEIASHVLGSMLKGSGTAVKERGRPPETGSAAKEAGKANGGTPVPTAE